MTASDPLEGIRLIDTDTHWSEPHDLWTSRVPASQRELVPHVVEVDGQQRWVANRDVDIGSAMPLSVVRRDGSKAIGLDWFTDYLSDADKNKLLEALVEKGIEPGLQLYESVGSDGRSVWVDPRPHDDLMPAETERADHEWPVDTFNWNIVSNTGMALAALAIRDYKPDLSERVLDHSVESIAHGFAEYGEGPGCRRLASSRNAAGR